MRIKYSKTPKSYKRDGGFHHSYWNILEERYLKASYALIVSLAQGLFFVLSCGEEGGYEYLQMNVQ